jgi:hypothetical protein
LDSRLRQRAKTGSLSAPNMSFMEPFFLPVPEIPHFSQTLYELHQCSPMQFSQFISFSSRKWLIILKTLNTQLYHQQGCKTKKKSPFMSFSYTYLT